ncbi:DUF1028 domain-containing protein [Gloeocapsopsis crepidinum LEGE 06123]|uniref:DUF1028 domain-containing protein n=1 Tax=Gloeocapsopsis crepidinum LEGE 06123 TaxID=588587 RepID=A0ABR9UNL1_9CHRO|nr:DUF1028 domain-containing protein [Gloeocapsopsis crepidinum]MBE9189867.1 DUF1028 domain-containing protein [Gloeocapsopsis crepidinum LEGE 06123]
MTFSIVAWDSTTQMTGVAVATKHLAVGALVPHAKATIGAIATQAQTNPLLGIGGIQLLEQRAISEGTLDEISVEDIIYLLLKDDKDRDHRQLHLVDHNGHTAAWTGKECIDWAGHFTFPYFSVAGNMLVGEQTLLAMAEAYQAKEGMEFSERLLQALEAGEAAGGDKRGRQSAAIYVVNQDVYPYLDLRVDHHNNPIAELRYLFEESRKDYYQMFRQTMPTRHPRTTEAISLNPAPWSSTKAQQQKSVSATDAPLSA